MELTQREEAQEEASIQLKRYLSNADTSKLLLRMDYEDGQGVMVRSKQGKNYYPMIINGELNKKIIPIKGIIDHLGVY